jgi:uncharacterized repeat protein (TIGR01451 family)
MSNARYGSACLAALLLLTCQAGSAQAPSGSPDLVISQVYGGGGNSGAPFNADFIELFNRGSEPVALDGLSLQYASATGTGLFGSPGITRLPDVNLAPGHYFLVREASGAAGVALPQPFYAAGSPIAMGAAAGKVALVRGTAPLGCNGGSTPCTPAQRASIIDLVGYGDANFFEGSGGAGGASNTTAVIRNAGGAVDTDDNRSDFSSGTPTPRNTGNLVALSIDDVTIAEGDAANPVATFTISLNNPALVPVTFTVATVDGTATGGLDFVAQPAETRTLAVGDRAVTFAVTILGDLLTEPDETFEVVLTDVTGVAVADDRGVGTIQNDDLPFFAIHDLQGSGEASPHAGERVATSGVVTGLKSNGFFMQTPDAEIDASAETSEGIFVFTGIRPTVAPGDQVRVSGQVVEFRRTSDVLPGALTEIGGTVQVTVLSSGNALPAPIDAASFDLSAATRSAQLERFESMLVRAASLTVVAPTNRFGEFFGVRTGTARPFREPGVDVHDVLPPGAPAGLPRFDANLERIMVDSDESLAGNVRREALALATGAVVTPVEGPLDYAFDAYRISLGATPAVVPGMTVAPAPAPAAGEFTAAALNLLNFNAPNPANPAQVAAFAARLQKASIVIRTILRTPDVVGLIEVGDINALDQLAARVNADAGTSYEAFLVEGIDNGPAADQDVGYLVNTARVAMVAEPEPYAKGETFTFCGDPDVLFDRPPFVLRASFGGMPATIVLNHLKSLIEVNSNAPYVPFTGGPCDGTVGERNRLKRRLGAERLADLLEDLQDENLIVLGDLNAFEFNDGYVDVLATVAGTPAPPDQVIAASDDRWGHSLLNLVTSLPAAQRYSFVFDGSAQALDHVLVNAPMRSRLTRFSFARLNADFPDASTADPSIPDRFSDHDGPVVYFAPAANLATSTAVPAAVISGSAFTYEVAVTNGGPDAAQGVAISNVLPAHAQFVSVLAPDGWTCTTAGGTLACEAGSLAAGATARFLVAMTASCAIQDGLPFTSATTASSPTERLADRADNESADAGAFSNPAPVIAGAVVDTPVLWPPNGKFHPVNVSYSVADNCGPVETELSVRSSDAERNQAGSEPDWVVTSANSVMLRAERSGVAKDGRIYTITITATDTAGNVTRHDVQVTVPHDR